MAVVDGSALLAAAVRAAILAKAPRRTVQSVAAAVAGVLLRPVAKAVPLAEGKARAGNVEGLATEKLETGASPEVLIAALVAARKARRRRKKENRCARADFASGGSPMHGVEVLQCRAVRASVPLSAVEGEEVFERAGGAAPCASVTAPFVAVGEAPAEEVASCGVAPMEGVDAVGEVRAALGDDLALTPESGSASLRMSVELTPESESLILPMPPFGTPGYALRRAEVFRRAEEALRGFVPEPASLPRAVTRSIPFYKNQNKRGSGSARRQL
jgi:hypothetical protein